MQGTRQRCAEAYLTYAAQATERVTPQRRLDPKPGVPVERLPTPKQGMTCAQ